MLKLIYTLDGAATVIERDIPISIIGKYGQAVVIDEGDLANVAAGDFPYAVLIADNTATGVETEYIAIREDQVFDIDIEGDVANVTPGSYYGFATDGMHLDAASLDGAMLVLRVDPIKSKATIRFIKK